MRKKNFLKKTSLQPITDFLLDLLLEVGSLMPHLGETPGQHIRRLKKEMALFPVNRYNQMLKRFEKQNMVMITTKRGKTVVELTEKGRLEALFRKLKKMHQKSKNRWNGKWYLIIFDIPEAHRKERHSLRQFLKSLNFYELQKSVYISPWVFSEEAVIYLKESGLIKYIRFLRVDRVDDESVLKKLFNIK